MLDYFRKNITLNLDTQIYKNKPNLKELRKVLSNSEENNQNKPHHHPTVGLQYYIKPFPKL